MPEPLYVFLGIVLVLSLLIHRRFVVAPRIGRTAGRWIDAGLLVLGVLAVTGYGSGELFDPAWARIPGFVGMTWLAAMMYLTLGALVLGAVVLVLRIVVRIRGQSGTTLVLKVNRGGSALIAAATIAVVSVGVLSAATPRVTETVVALDRLPPTFDGLRVAVVSDIHVGPTRGEQFVEEVVAEINAQSPDLVLLAGDLIDGTVALVGDTLTPLQDLSAPLGVFAVTGNHEYYSDDVEAWMNLWSELDVRVLRNEGVQIERGGSSILLAGISDATAPEPFAPDLVAALDTRGAAQFTLLVAHQPVQALGNSGHDIDLQVSGHTHAGQLWPLRYLVPLQQPSIEGLDQIGDTTLYTTRGAGTWGPPVRVAAIPEISILQLTGPRSG